MLAQSCQFKVLQKLSVDFTYLKFNEVGTHFRCTSAPKETLKREAKSKVFG
jgi:hypothetical protein